MRSRFWHRLPHILRLGKTSEETQSHNQPKDKSNPCLSTALDQQETLLPTELHQWLHNIKYSALLTRLTVCHGAKSCLKMQHYLWQKLFLMTVFRDSFNILIYHSASTTALTNSSLSSPLLVSHHVICWKFRCLLNTVRKIQSHRSYFWQLITLQVGHI